MSDRHSMAGPRLRQAVGMLRRSARFAISGPRLARDYRVLLRLRRTYRRRYGLDFVTTIHPADEMLRFFRSQPGSNRARAEIAYLSSGEAMLRELGVILDGVQRPLSGLDSILEFASGYGRLTRFLVTRLKETKVVVSDIDTDALAFSRSAFGVDGFPSSREARDLAHAGRYEVVFVASLFSHLTLSQWGPWLRRLRELLRSDGLLIFSTHGERPHRVSGQRSHQLAPGFFFEAMSEAEGRLALDYYGTAYAFPRFVEEFVSSNGLGRLVQWFQNGLYGWQDVYVIGAES